MTLRVAIAWNRGDGSSAASTAVWSMVATVTATGGRRAVVSGRASTASWVGSAAANVECEFGGSPLDAPFSSTNALAILSNER